MRRGRGLSCKCLVLLLCAVVPQGSDVSWFDGVRRPRVLDAEAANRPEQLVPIRLELDVEHHKMRDTFVWNLSGTFSWRLFHIVEGN